MRGRNRKERINDLAWCYGIPCARECQRAHPEGLELGSLQRSGAHQWRSSERAVTSRILRSSVCESCVGAYAPCSVPSFVRCRRECIDRVWELVTHGFVLIHFSGTRAAVWSDASSGQAAGRMLSAQRVGGGKGERSDGAGMVDGVEEPRSVGLAQIQLKISSGPLADNADASPSLSCLSPSSMQALDLHRNTL